MLKQWIYVNYAITVLLLGEFTFFILTGEISTKDLADIFCMRQHLDELAGTLQVQLH